MAFLMVQCKHGPSDGGLIQSLATKNTLRRTSCHYISKHFTRYTHTHVVPHAKHMESFRPDEMAKRGRDDSASVPLLCSLPT